MKTLLRSCFPCFPCFPFFGMEDFKLKKRCFDWIYNESFLVSGLLALFVISDVSSSEKKTISLAEQNFISGQSSVVGCLQSWRYEKQQDHAEAWWVWFWLPSRLVPPMTLGVDKNDKIYATLMAEKWNWIVEIACQTLVFETAVIEEGIENITWALSIKQTPY